MTKYRFEDFKIFELGTARAFGWKHSEPFRKYAVENAWKYVLRIEE